MRLRENMLKILERKFKHLQRLNERRENEDRQWRKKILKKRILISLAITKKQLKFYVNREWIGRIAYDVLILDINSIINKLN